MSINKNAVIIAVVASFVVAIALAVILPSGKRPVDGGGEVITMRARVEAPVERAAEEIAPQATPAPLAPVAAPAVKQAPAQKAAEKAMQKAPAKKAAKAPASATSKKASPAPRASVKLPPNPWAVNVASFAGEADASRLVAALKKAGYSPYITTFVKDGVTWHRVRIGFYASREDAVKAGKSVQSRFNVQSPWVVQPTRSEAAGHTR